MLWLLVGLGVMICSSFAFVAGAFFTVREFNQREDALREDLRAETYRANRAEADSEQLAKRNAELEKALRRKVRRVESGRA